MVIAKINVVMFISKAKEHLNSGVAIIVSCFTLKAIWRKLVTSSSKQSDKISAKTSDRIPFKIDVFKNKITNMGHKMVFNKNLINGFGIIRLIKLVNVPRHNT